MIILVHDNQKMVKLYSKDRSQKIDYDSKKPLISVLFDVAKLFPREFVIWTHQDYEAFIDFKRLDTVFHHRLIMASHAINGEYAISKQIGYVEQKPYTNVFDAVSFPTWLMSSDVGGIHAEILNEIKGNRQKERNFELALTSLAKQAMPKGLFCYSEPALLDTQKEFVFKEKKVTTYQLFKFVRRHYKFAWTINLLLCFVIFENKLPLLSFFKSLFTRSLSQEIDLSGIEVKSQRSAKIKKEIDVIIPTLGREQCLYDVLKDLSNQSVLPKNVIVVEQNPDINSKTALHYMTNEDWPFKIKHYFTHQTGACNARNIAIGLVESEWTFFADDDIRFDGDLMEKAFGILDKYGNNALNLLCLQPNEKQSYFLTVQTDIFGSGTSILKSTLLKDIRFDMAFEFGFGEDSDFGMQIRKQGTDVLFIPEIKITHLKAPIGGFRTKVKKRWEDEIIQPKPSPTIMLFAKKHFNRYQRNGYKYVLFIKFYKNQRIKNPWKYLNKMNKQWDSSMMWAEKIQLENETVIAKQ